MSNNESELNYYFVPLGREPGGYLDLLGLRPTASESESAAEENAYRLEIDSAFKSKCKKLKAVLEYKKFKARLKDGEIDQAKFDAEIEKKTIPVLGDAEIIAVWSYRVLEAQLDSNQITRQTFEKKIKELAAIGYRELNQQREKREITQEEFQNQFAERKASLANSSLSQEEIEAHLEEIKAELETTELTEEEFKARMKEWEAETSKQLAQFNDLKATYNTMLAQKRGLANRGLRDEIVIWEEMYQCFRDDTSLFWQRALGHGPLPQTSYENMPSQTADNTLTSLAFLRAFVDARDQRHVSLADSLWSKLQCPGRQFWQDKINTWVEEIEHLGPSLNIKQAVGAPGIKPEFPVLCEPFPLAIDHLETTVEEEDVSQLPKRAGDVQRIDLGALLAAMMARQNAPSSAVPPGEQKPQFRQAPLPGQGARRPRIVVRRIKGAPPRQGTKPLRGAKVRTLTLEEFQELQRRLAQASDEKG